MTKFQDRDRFRRPELFLADLINKSARGELREEEDNVRIWYRATVIAVDVLGGKLENPNGEGSLEHIISGITSSVTANIGPQNPSNSVKARILTDEFDQFVSDDDLTVFWPMMPEHDSIPIKPGEHIYVTFEDESFEHGLWFGKVSGHENTNLFIGESSFTAGHQTLNRLFGDEPDEPTSNDKEAGGRLIDNSLNKLFSGE